MFVWEVFIATEKESENKDTVQNRTCFEDFVTIDQPRGIK